MSQLLVYYNAIETALTPYWAELIGAFLMAAMINLINIKGSQRYSFNLISFGFYTLIARDLFQAFQNIRLREHEKQNRAVFRAGNG